MSSYISLPHFATTIGERLRLLGATCKGCGAVLYPQRTHCLDCNATSFEETELSGRGKIYTFTVIAAGGAPAEFDQQQSMTGAITVAVVELEEGPRVIAQIQGEEGVELEIGTPVVAAHRRLYDQEGIVRYGVKFLPAAAG